MLKLGQLIREKREALGLNQREFASRIRGINPNVISTWEIDRSVPGEANWAPLEDALGLRRGEVPAIIALNMLERTPCWRSFLTDPEFMANFGGPIGDEQPLPPPASQPPTHAPEGDLKAKVGALIDIGDYKAAMLALLGEADLESRAAKAALNEGGKR